MKRWIYTTLTLATFGATACEDAIEAPMEPELEVASEPVVSPDFARALVESQGDLPYHTVGAVEGGGGVESCTTVNFEGISDATTVGTVAGVVTATFGASWYALVDIDDGGNGNFANEPSSMTAAAQMDLSDVDIVLDQPVTSVSVYYSAASETLPLTLEGLDGTGATVASQQGNTVGFDLFGSLCTGDPNGMYCAWDVLQISTADPQIETVRLTGVGSSGQFHIDDLMLCGAGGADLPVEDNVSVDIKPGSDENPVNPSSEGNLPVALLGSEELDVTTVDLESLTLGDGEEEDTPVARDGGDRPMARIVDVNGDGFDDVMAHFNVGVMVENGDLTWETTELVLSASLLPEAADETTESSNSAVAAGEGGETDGDGEVADAPTLRGSDFVRIVGEGGDGDVGEEAESADADQPRDLGQGEKKGHDKQES